MIIWLNGAFGGGKTTLAAELHRRLRGSLVFDPEQVGHVLTEIVTAPTGNFQDLPLWRSQVVSLGLGLVREYGRPVIAPMTLVEPRYAEEIHGGLRAAGVPVHHFFLDVGPDELVRRLDARINHEDDPARDERVRQWTKDQIPAATAALATLSPDTVVLDGERPTAELADEVIAHVEGRDGGSPGV
ncbi:AAA family ATPase [Streptomyces sp. NPDC020141]|uniref:AAA family ATPase n=1 Tax=Streptomyces sp. NPDC020141 TaxID=3365065 RepID=UPI003788D4EF